MFEQHHSQMFATLCLRYINDWKRRSEKGEAIPMYHEAERMTSDVAVSVIFGELLPNDKLQYIHKQFVIFSQGLFMPNFGLPEGIPGTAYHRSFQVLAFSNGST